MIRGGWNERHKSVFLAACAGEIAMKEEVLNVRHTSDKIPS
jgi:hypothetical protein